MDLTVIDFDAVYGYVNYGSIKIDRHNAYGYTTKMRCKNCGAAWLAENHINGHSTCPQCNTSEKKYIMSIE